METRLSYMNDWQETAETVKTRVTTAVQDNPWPVVIPGLLVTALLLLWLKSAKSE